MRALQPLFHIQTHFCICKSPSLCTKAFFIDKSLSLYIRVFFVHKDPAYIAVTFLYIRALFYMKDPSLFISAFLYLRKPFCIYKVPSVCTKPLLYIQRLLYSSPSITNESHYLMKGPSIYTRALLYIQRIPCIQEPFFIYKSFLYIQELFFIYTGLHYTEGRCLYIKAFLTC